MPNIQLTPSGKLQHLLSTDGLPQALVLDLLQCAESFLYEGESKKLSLLHGKTVCNLFFENSTRTRTTFEIAAKRLGADVLNLNVSASSQSKGETVQDMVNNLIAMQADIFVVRHNQAGAAHCIAQQVPNSVHIINAGDGQHAHPTQGLLDAFTIRKYKPDMSQLCVVLVGDIRHSRVARADIHVLKTLGVSEIRVVAPNTLLPADIDKWGVRVFHDMESGLKQADVVIMLRLQHERMSSAMLPSSNEYFRIFGLTQEKLAYAKEDAIVLHPGPMNRGVEIDSAVADGTQSVILVQVTHGIAIRMAVMSMLCDV